MEFSFDVSLLKQYVLWFVLCWIFFSLFAFLSPNIPKQKLFRANNRIDLLYWFLMPQVYQWVSHIFLWSMLYALYYFGFSEYLLQRSNFGLFVHLPVYVQVAVVLCVTDMIQYWTHRLFHTRMLWNFHVIHHAPKELDWFSGIRFHPINLIIHSVLVGACVYILGFSPIVYEILLPFNIFYSALVHANVNWTFGPLRYIFASPIFHRWHHTSASEGGEKNFAPTFSILDVLFGTFSMPQNTSPQIFGVQEQVPDTFFGQLIFPFYKKRK